MSIRNEHRAARELSAAVSGLLIAACELGLAGRYAEALAANSAAKQANQACQEICDAVLSRWYARIILWVHDAVKRGTKPSSVR